MHGGFMVSAPPPPLLAQGPDPSLLHSGVLMGTSEFNAGDKPCAGLASHPGGVEILLVFYSIHTTETGILAPS